MFATARYWLRMGAELRWYETAIVLALVIWFTEVLGLPGAAMMLFFVAIYVLLRGYELTIRYLDPLRRGSITTDRVSLRPLVRSDTTAVGATIDEMMMEGNGWSDDQRREALEQFAGRSRLGRMGYYVAEVSGLTAAQGVIVVRRQQGLPHRPTVGLWLGPAARGRGIGTEAFQGMCALASNRGVPELWLSAHVDNHAVRRIAERAGGTEEARGDLLLPNGSKVPAVTYRVPTG